MVMLVDFCFLPTSSSLRRHSMNGGIFFTRLLEASFLYKYSSKLALYLTYFFVYAQRHIQNPVRSSRLEVFCWKVVLENFAKFTGKYMCQSLYFHKVAGLRPAT